MFRSVAVFVLAYLLLMLPTYVLPYFGSNSALVNAFSAAAGGGLTPLWWMHVWSLVMLSLTGHMRGKWIGKGYLTLFPFLAAVFDMVPGLNLVPLVPTVMHLVALIMDAVGHVPVVSEGEQDQAAVALPTSFKVAWAAGLMTCAAIVGSLFFLHGINFNYTSWPFGLL